MAENKNTDCILKVTLSEPIEMRAKETGEVLSKITELKFRKPTGMDIAEVGGNPVTMDMFASDPMSTIRFDGKMMTAMMTRLSGRIELEIRKLSAADWTYCAWGLAGFFLPTQPGTSSAPA